MFAVNTPTYNVFSRQNTSQQKVRPAAFTTGVNENNVSVYVMFTHVKFI